MPKKNFNRNSEPESREAQEKGENLRTERVDAPAERFQKDQQVTSVDKSGQMQTPKSSFQYKEVDLGGSSLRQEVASEVVKNATGGPYEVSSPSRSGLRSMNYSGDAGTLTGDYSGIPKLSKDIQGKTRVDKRLSDANKDINYLASETVAVKYQNVAPLAGSDAKIGYNGTPKNMAARSQKKSGLTSAELLYDRSVDYICRDEMVFTTGQVVKQNGVDTADYPTKTYENGTYEVDGVQMVGWHETPFSRTRGNYAPRNLRITLTRNSANAPAYVKSFDFDVDDYSCNAEDFVTVNKAATNHKIDVNAAELARQTIDQEAGSPTSPHYNPLGRSVAQPSPTVLYLRDLESTLGATVFTAYKFAQKARGHYLMRTIKDGQDIVLPAVDALHGHLMNVNSRNELNSAFTSDTGSPYMSKAGMKAGSASLMVGLFDSLSKYQTKADLINLPRGLKLNYQTADNNMDPFRVKKEFVAALNSIDVYSTIDRGYDAMAPICVTDNVRLVYPYNFHDMLNFTRSQPGDRTYGSTLFTYRYAAGSGNQTYYVKAGEPMLNGLAYFFDLHAQKIYDLLKANSSDHSDIEIVIPCVHSTMHFSLWDQLIMAATPYMIYERTNTMKDILDFQEFVRYPFNDLIPIKEANPMNAVNYSNPSFLEPLVPGKMLASSAIRWIWPEKFSTLGNDVMAPFYFNEDSFDYGGSAGSPTLTDNGSANLSTPVIRSGVRLAGLDSFWGMEPDDTLLSYDPMVKIPGTTPGTAFSGYGYKYSVNSEGLVVLKSAFFSDLTLQQLHSTPRMLGWYMPAYVGECCAYGAENTKGRFRELVSSSTNGLKGETGSYRVILYKAPWANAATEIPTTILAGSQLAINRAQAFTQFWTMARSTAAGYSRGEGFDLCLSLGEAVTNTATPSLKTDFTLFKPYVRSKSTMAGNANIYDGHYLISIHRALWAIAQKLPFILNPFDDVTGASVDPFSWAYVFGLAGFMSANYDEMEYNRMNQVQNQRYGYTADPFTAASPVFKDAYSKTSIG